MNPMQILSQFMSNGGNPQELVMKTIEMSSVNPTMINNLVNMAKQGNYQGVEQFARNYLKGNGMDFDKEYNSFMSNFKNN